MTQTITFSLDRPGLDGVRFVIVRERLPEAGDLEAEMFDGVRDLVRARPGVPFGATVARAAESADLVVVARNPQLVLDRDLPARIAAARESLPNQPWALMASGGLGPHGRTHLALYSTQDPAIPLGSSPWPILDARADLYLLDGAMARDYSASAPDDAFETTLIAQGYREGRVSLFLAELRGAIDGGFLPRDKVRHATALGDVMDGGEYPTLAGPVTLPAPVDQPPLLETAEALLAGLRPVPTLSIVVRTLFRRAHLLDRLLTSIQRARIPDVTLDIVLASDAPDASAHFKGVESRFRNLPIRLAAAEGHLPSRVANLCSGIAVAESDFTCLIDDDDQVDLFAFSAFAGTLHAEHRPIIAVTTELRRECWTETPSGRWVLESARPDGAYPARGWRGMFTGVNRMPICGLILPTAWLRNRTACFAPVHDLSEDYALFLHLLTAPDLPEIVEAEGTFCIVSLREDDQTVVMSDRRPWARDIAGHLAALTESTPAPGLWQLLAANHSAATPDRDLESTCTRLATELRLAEGECARLRRMIQRENA